MTRKNGKKTEQVAFKGFANVSLTKARKSDIRALVEAGVDYDKWLENLVAEGYKVSISWADDPGYYSVTAFQTKADSDHVGWGTTARHGALATAIASLYYQVNVVLSDEGWPDGNANYEW